MVIVAPPGYGKSTLLAEWEAHDDRRYVSVPQTDPTTCAAQLTLSESIRCATHAIRLSGRPCVLVLDDAHLADAEAQRRIVDEAMVQLPAGSALALASRREPALPLGRMRAHRTVVEVRVDDLALTSAEAASVLRRSGLELDFGVVQTLVQRTEGWPAALYLTALSAREQEDASTAVKQLRGDDHRLAEYFRDDILSDLSASQTEFAVRTSVLTELSGGLCDSVLGSRGSGVLLREMQRASPLLRPVDPAHERYRWHGLVREALQAELRRTERELWATLHARASSWYLARGNTDEAIAHAVGARDCELVGELLWATVLEYVSQGRNSLVQGWLRGFSRAELAGHPRLALAAAHSFMAAGDAAAARQLAVAAAAAGERATDTAPARDSPRAGLAGIEGHARTRRGSRRWPRQRDTRLRP